MALSILNNISALEAENQLNITSAAAAKSLQQLSSGSRINSGADDAAGLSISDGLNANVAALNQSSENATNTVGSLQTADGALAQVTALPFGSPSAFVRAQATLAESREILMIAQAQHRAVVEAIGAREGTRAEAIMREHARVAQRNLKVVLHSADLLATIPGGALIRRFPAPTKGPRKHAV